MTTPYAIIPTPPNQAGHDAIAYGVAIFRFVLVHSTTCTCTTEQLELADHAYPVLVQHPEILPTAVDRLSTVRRLILATLASRRKAQAARDAMLREWAATADSEAQAGSQADPDSQQAADPRDQAIRLLRAGLAMIQGDETDPSNQGGGGSRVPVAPRPPKFPPSTQAARPEDNNHPAIDIRF